MAAREAAPFTDLLFIVAAVVLGKFFDVIIRGMRR